MLDKVLVNKDRINYIEINPIQYIKVKLHKDNPLEPVKEYWKSTKVGLFGNVKEKEYVVEFDFNLDKIITKFEFEYQGKLYSGSDRFKIHDIPSFRYNKVTPNKLPTSEYSSIAVIDDGTWVEELNIKLRSVLHGVKYTFCDETEISVKVRVNPYLIVNLVDGTALILNYRTNKELTESVKKINETFNSVNVL